MEERERGVERIGRGRDNGGGRWDAHSTHSSYAVNLHDESHFLLN